MSSAAVVIGALRVKKTLNEQRISLVFASLMTAMLHLEVVVVVVVLLFYVHGKHLRSCRDSQLTNHTFPGQA